MAERTLNCAACGAPIEVESRFTTLVVCQYCGQTLYIHDDAVDPTGKTAKLVDYGSRLALGKAGAVRGRRFKALGRVRYNYEGGFWDEWFLRFDDGQVGWLEEDEGEYTLVFKTRLTSPLPPFGDIAVGSVVPVSQMRVFITEKGTGSVAGAEGEISFAARPGEQIQYIDGNAGGKAIRLVITRSGINLSTGEPLEFHDLQV
ncbi:MAG: DUF4178 domain-containing protein [Chloroflexi bacterium]|nr:DUF4178 domain-containing protein [Chloroflexota bacterium]